MHRLICVAFGKAAVPGRQYQAGSQSFNVPFPGTGVGFVEIVDVEKERSLWRGEGAEIRQMTISARLHGDTRNFRGCEVSRLDDGMRLGTRFPLGLRSARATFAECLTQFASFSLGRDLARFHYR